MPAPPKLVKLTIEVPETLHRAAKLEAVKRRTTVRALVVEGLERVVSRKTREEAQR